MPGQAAFQQVAVELVAVQLVAFGLLLLSRKLITSENLGNLGAGKFDPCPDGKRTKFGS